ncbi:MAG: indole-3-glycerol phosphate synthase TrpC [Syntrophobacter sp.]
MSDFLSKIIEHKKREVQEAEKLVPERLLQLEAEKPAARRSLFDRLSNPGPFGMNVIAEIKRASPSKGPIRANVDPKSRAAMYQRGGAAAISVLTDREFFSGGVEDLRDARSTVELPVLRKDFVIGAYQVYESAVIGADAVLLIVRALAPESLKELITLCGHIGLDALVEVHNKPELEIAISSGARIIGINNRDLMTFVTNIQTSIDLAGHAGSGRVIVSESGIHGRAEIERLLDAGVFNFLIGESIMRSDDPEGFLRTLHGVSK